ILDSGTLDWAIAKPAYNNTTSILVRYGENISATAVNLNNVTQAAPMTWANGDRLHLYVQVPIVGWTSGNPTAASANLNAPVVFKGTQTSQALTGGSTDATFTMVKDTVGMWSTNVGTVKVPGDYVAIVSGTLSGTGALDFYKNGSFAAR